MLSALDTALGGLQRNERGFQVVANNIANVNTDGFRAQRYHPASDTVSDRYEPSGPAAGVDPDAPPPSDVDLATEFVAMKRNEVGYRANTAVILTADRMMGALLDLFA